MSVSIRIDMGNTDSIPVISQVKSLVQVITGDEEGAKKTQENFSKLAPIVSQARSAYHALDGDLEQAKNIQKDFGVNAVAMAAAAAAAAAIRIPRGRRSIISDDYVPFDHTLPELPSQYLLKLPGSLKDIEIKEEMSSQAAVDAIFSVFLVLKLIGIGHIKSKPYYEEICSAFYPAMFLNECETTLFHAFNKYENQEEVVAEDFAVEKQDKVSLFADVIDGLEFEAGSLSRHTAIGQFIETSACGDSEQCYIEVEAGIASLRKLERFLLGGRKRFKNYRNEKFEPLVKDIWKTKDVSLKNIKKYELAKEMMLDSSVKPGLGQNYFYQIKNKIGRIPEQKMEFSQKNVNGMFNEKNEWKHQGKSVLDVGKATNFDTNDFKIDVFKHPNKPNTFIADNNRGLTAHAMAQKNVGRFHVVDSSQAKNWKATSYEKISFDKNIPDSKVLGAFGYGQNVPIGGIKLSFEPRKD